MKPSSHIGFWHSWFRSIFCTRLDVELKPSLPSRGQQHPGESADRTLDKAPPDKLPGSHSLGGWHSVPGHEQHQGPLQNENTCPLFKKQEKRSFPFFCSFPWPVLFYLLFNVSSLRHRAGGRGSMQTLRDPPCDWVCRGHRQASTGPLCHYAQATLGKGSSSPRQGWQLVTQTQWEGRGKQGWAWTQVPSPWYRLHRPFGLHLQTTSTKIKLFRTSRWLPQSLKASGAPFWAWGPVGLHWSHTRPEHSVTLWVQPTLTTWYL